jgi:hypothetical protein
MGQRLSPPGYWASVVLFSNSFFSKIYFHYLLLTVVLNPVL